MIRSIIGLLLVLTATLAQAATVLVLGDSLSAGFGLSADQAWPAHLQRKLDALPGKHTVINASVSGETTAGGRARLPQALEAHAPNVVVIELGANDGLRGLPVKLMRENLLAMVDAAEAAGAKVVLVGMRLPPNYGPVYTRLFQNTFAEVAKTRHLAFVPFLLDGFAEDRALFQADGMHPTADAQPRIVDTMWPALKPLLPAAVSRR
ncbi:arylesterase [Denitromonas ohlonensis]|uniref:Arylesterase n=2 Tax=Denitromonas TaxID=139331 RepID=A0A558EA66_9RHOO|nr:arylesterase [Denitromonas ohlonensis]TVO65754.1 arylesterase [Denitromonas ohlonensis]TVO79347.1 arylesterase [Denitromonas ohlonensis]TVT70237.1 MAG: arylesterase [Denitromonas halophila]